MKNEMNYYGSSQLADSMRTVRRHTITIAADIPEESYDYRPASGSRSVRETLLHIASMTRFDLHVYGEQRLDSLEAFDFRAFFASLPTQENLPKTEILSCCGRKGSDGVSLSRIFRRASSPRKYTRGLR